MAKGQHVPSIEDLKRRQEGLPPLEPEVEVLPPEEEIKQTLSKPTREELLDILDRNKLDPVQELIDMYHDRDEDGELTMKRGERIALMKELMKYVHPQKKTTDGGNRGQGNLVVVLNMPDGSQDQRVLDVRSK